MLRTKLVCSTGGMKRIAEEDEAFDVGSACGSNLGGDSSAQRFAANDQRAAADLFVPDSLDHGPKTRFEGLIRIRNAPALLRIQKIERDDVNSARCKPGRKSRHEITILIGASTVPKNHRDTGEVRLARTVDEGRHFLIWGNLDAHFVRHGAPSRAGLSLPRCLGCCISRCSMPR